MPKPDPRVDAYIRKAAPFAQPVLSHIRAIVHQACPDAVETMKWSRPFFDFNGPLCGMAAFKAHCSLHFWKGGNIVSADESKEGAMGQFGRITSVKDLPPKRTLVAIVKKAAANVVGLRDRTVDVGEQRIVEIVGVGPPLLLLDGVAADPDALHAGRGEFGGEIAEVAGLLRAARRERRRVEEERDRTVGEEFREPPGRAGLIGQGEVGCGVTGFHTPSLPATHLPRGCPVALEVRAAARGRASNPRGWPCSRGGRKTRGPAHGSRQWSPGPASRRATDRVRVPR